jgi:hypothetical protein
MISNPQYGKNILSRFSEKITVYDYSDIESQYGNEGISVLGWDGRYSFRINYKNMGVSFIINDDYFTYIDCIIFYENLTKSHYEYFSDVIEYLQLHREKLKQINNEFRQILPINYIRNEKLNQII